MSVFDKITAQQGEEGTQLFYLGEQLKDICRADPHAAELVDKDLDVKGMQLKDLGKKLDAVADEKHRKSKGRIVVISPKEADGIIRDFFGLSKEEQAECKLRIIDSPPSAARPDNILDLSAFL